MGRKVRKNRRRIDPLRQAAELPERLQIWIPADWLPADAPPEPADGYDLAAWEAWETAHRLAYAAFNKARADWYAQHELLSLEEAIATPDEAMSTPERVVDEADVAAMYAAGPSRTGPPPGTGYRAVPLAPVKRSTTLRDKFRKKIARDEPPCYHCGREINYEADHLDPLSFTIDHLVPLAGGGQDSLDNLVASCRACNLSKGDRQLSAAPTVAVERPECPPGPCARCRGVHHPRPGVSFVTSRVW